MHQGGTPSSQDSLCDGPELGAGAVNFLAQPLNQQKLYYMFSLIVLLLQTLAKLRDEHAQAVVVASHFPEQVWTPLLCEGVSRFVELNSNAQVANQASAKLSASTCLIAYKWRLPAASPEPH